MLGCLKNFGLKVFDGKFVYGILEKFSDEENF